MKRVRRARAVGRKEVVEGEEAFVRGGSVVCGSDRGVEAGEERGEQWIEWSWRRGVKEAVV